MKDSRKRAKQVKRRKVASLAAYSRKHTVKHGMISKVEGLYQVPWDTITNKLTRFNIKPNMAGKYYIKNNKGELKPINHSFNIPKEGYPQPKLLKKKYKKKYWLVGECGIRKVIKRPSDYDQFKDNTFHPNKGRAWYMEQMVQHKIAKWERKNPCPVKEDQNPPDIFEREYLIPWKAERELALERIRDFVVSVYDKLHIIGNRIDRKNGTMVGKTVAEVKDVDGKGHNIAHPNLRESDQLYKDATEAAQNAMNKDLSIVDCDLKNHKGDQKRPLINAKRSKTTPLQRSKNLKQHKELRKAA